MSQPLIILPVYNALEFLEPCLDSITRHTSPDVMTLVINDASTDPGVEPLLRAWVEQPGTRHQLITQRVNRGFVATVNNGMRSARSDVVLLNSDTVVTTGWLDSLAKCLGSDRSIATATPWSNNGEIVSIPDFCQPSDPPSNPDATASVIASCGLPRYPEIPTAVGFCMAISLQAINRVGLFDEATFGRGYGEENDFCERAIKMGMRNVLCDDAYVVHHGRASFGPLGLKPDENSMQRLLSKHPEYEHKVKVFLNTDPLASRRHEILECLDRAGMGMR
jgi:GT2 family glycosyltransferase